MLCRKPYVKGLLPFGCGQCNPCRFNRRRLWSHRIMLESAMHPESVFTTLTYNEEFHPKDGSLCIDHYQKFLKKLRRRLEPRKIRYFMVGEYGEQSQRPHYHAALFNVYSSDLPALEDSWGKGFVHCGTLTFDSAQYIAGYVVKKLTNVNDKKVVDFLQGRYPEFARMSLKPGIGADGIIPIADALIGYLPEDDVPRSLCHDGKSYPLGRYLRSKLREKMGFSENGTPKEKLEEWAMQMLGLYEEHVSSQGYKKTFKKVIVDLKAQEALILEKRSKIFKKGSVL